MRRPDASRAVDGLTGTESNAVNGSAGASSPRVLVDDKSPYIGRCDPDHGTPGTADIGDEHDSKYLKGGQNPIAGYTGHVPRAKEVIGSTFYGPTIGNSYHGPAMVDDPMGFVRPSSPNKVADCP